MIKRILILTAVAALMLATGAQAGTPDELAIKQDLMESFHYRLHDDITALKIQICGNNITVSAPFEWVKMVGDEFAYAVACSALFEDVKGNPHSPVYQYFHVLILDSDGVTIGEAVVNRADYPK